MFGNINNDNVYTARRKIADQEARKHEKNLANTKTCPVCNGKCKRIFAGTCAACSGSGRVRLDMSYQEAWWKVEQHSIGKPTSSRYYGNSSASKGDLRHKKYKKW